DLGALKPDKSSGSKAEDTVQAGENTRKHTEVGSNTDIGSEPETVDYRQQLRATPAESDQEETELRKSEPAYEQQEAAQLENLQQETLEAGSQEESEAS